MKKTPEKAISLIFLATKQNIVGKTLEEVSRLKGLRLYTFSILEKNLFKADNDEYIKALVDDVIMELKKSLRPTKQTKK